MTKRINIKMAARYITTQVPYAEHSAIHDLAIDLAPNDRDAYEAICEAVNDIFQQELTR
jgi:hypothetical protein